jgi:hypothetical protein
MSKMGFELNDRVMICNTVNLDIEKAFGQIIGFYTYDHYIVQLDIPIRGGQTDIIISKYCLISELLVTKEL